MKTCPTCDRTYDDETLSFCLEDGTVLSAAYDPEETLVRGGGDPIVRNTEPGYRPDLSTATYVSPRADTSPSSDVPRSKSLTPHVIYAVAGLIGIVIIAVAVGGAIWMTSGRNDQARDRTNVSNQKNSAVFSSPTPIDSRTPTATQTPTVNQTPPPTPPPTATQTPIVTRPPSNEDAKSNAMGARLGETAMDGTRLTFYQQPNVGQCESACARNGNCKGWTWNKAGTYNADDAAMCYLLSAVTKTTHANGHTSGIKGRL